MTTTCFFYSLGIFIPTTIFNGELTASCRIAEPLCVFITNFKLHSREDARVLGRQLLNWKKGDLESLLEEFSSIQYHLDSPAHHAADSYSRFARRFAKLMMEEKLHATTCLIDDNPNSFSYL